MPIINIEFDRNRAEAAIAKIDVVPHLRAHNLRPLIIEKGREIYLYDTHVGYCIRDYERNGYDDSDFMMEFWNPVTNKPETICFASTRGWSYPAYGSHPDAGPDIRKAYDDYVAYHRKKSYVMGRWSQRNKDIEIAKACNFPNRFIVNRIRKVFVGDEWLRVEKLLTSNLRSEFRINIRNQIIKWAMEENPKYNSPLSAKQRRYI
jgi:hypothetical protein